MVPAGDRRPRRAQGGREFPGDGELGRRREGRGGRLVAPPGRVHEYGGSRPFPSDAQVQRLPDGVLRPDREQEHRLDGTGNGSEELPRDEAHGGGGGLATVRGAGAVRRGERKIRTPYADTAERDGTQQPPNAVCGGCPR